LLDLLGQRRLGHKQPLRRAGEVSFGRDGGEGAQQPGVDIHALRLWRLVLDVRLADRPGLTVGGGLDRGETLKKEF
jgi:hypothetical protein